MQVGWLTKRAGPSPCNRMKPSQPASGLKMHFRPCAVSFIAMHKNQNDNVSKSAPAAATKVLEEKSASTEAKFKWSNEMIPELIVA